MSAPHQNLQPRKRRISSTSSSSSSSLPSTIKQEENSNKCCKTDDLNECERKSLEIMRKCCNLYKRHLWTRFGLQQRVLDLGSGKGGDLQKVLHAQVRLYVGIDQNEEFLNDAKLRYNEIPDWKRRKFPTIVRFLGPVLMQSHSEVDKLIEQDINHQQINQSPQSPTVGNHSMKHLFDVITAFWSIHSVFENEKQLCRFADCVDHFLTLETGIFVCVFMDGDEIVSWMNEEKCAAIESPQKLLKIERTKPKTFQVFMSAETVPLHEEYHVSLPELTSALKSHNIDLIETHLLRNDMYLSSEEKANLLPVHNRFLSCNRYCVFKRTCKVSKSPNGSQHHLEQTKQLLNHN